MDEQLCRGCDRSVISAGRHGWSLTDYFGFSGVFCADCYDRIAHDADLKPKRPAEYLAMRIKLAGVDTDMA